MKYLFIGGKFDGQRLEVEGMPRTFSIPYFPDMVSQNGLSIGPNMNVVHYNLALFRSINKDIAVYALNGLVEASVFEALVDGYQGMAALPKGRNKDI